MCSQQQVHEEYCWVSTSYWLYFRFVYARSLFICVVCCMIPISSQVSHIQYSTNLYSFLFLIYSCRMVQLVWIVGSRALHWYCRHFRHERCPCCVIRFVARLFLEYCRSHRATGARTFLLCQFHFLQSNLDSIQLDVVQFCTDSCCFL